ncbi:MAG: phosphatase PAP2 family protein [Mycobacteriales bacterium]
MNTSLLLHLNSWAASHAWADGVVRFFAKDVIALVGLGLLVLLAREVRRRGVRAGVPTAVVLGVSFLLGLLAGVAYPERRPFQDHPVRLLFSHDPGQSFPSDHATAAFACAVAVALLLSRGWGVLLFVLAFAIGAARVAAGLHYPGDVLGSLLVAVIGGCAGLLARRLLDRSPAMLVR